MSRYVAAPPGDWIHTDDVPAPRFAKICIYTRHGVEILGEWSDTPLYVLWMPLTEVKKDMKERLRKEGKI